MLLCSNDVIDGQQTCAFWMFCIFCMTFAVKYYQYLKSFGNTMDALMLVKYSQITSDSEKNMCDAFPSINECKKPSWI